MGKSVAGLGEETRESRYEGGSIRAVGVGHVVGPLEEVIAKHCLDSYPLKAPHDLLQLPRIPPLHRQLRLQALLVAEDRRHGHDLPLLPGLAPGKI